MKILVMGGNQFLGKALVKKLLLRNYDVSVLNRGSRENLKGAFHIKADRNNYEELFLKLANNKFDIVIDVSAYTGEQVEKLYRVIKGKFKQYILISSASIYNNNTQFPVDEKSDVGGNNLWNDYAKNKFLAEIETKKMAENYTIFRPFYIYGIGNNLEREQYIFSRLENNLPIYLPDKGENIIQFGYIEDLVEGIIYAFENKEFYREVFNISGDEYISIVDFVKLCGRIVNKNIDIRYIECNEKIKARDWFPFRNLNLYGDIKKLKGTGFKNNHTLKEGLSLTYKYLKENTLLKYPKLANIEME